jgi:hypothetical protein
VETPLHRSSGSQIPASHNRPVKDISVRKLTAIVAALGFLASTNLTPVWAAPATGTGFKSDDLSAAKKKKPAAKKKYAKKKMSELTLSSDFSAAKKKKPTKKKYAKKKKMGELTLSSDLSAAKKKKKPAKKGKKKMGENVILYRIAA